jgi:hypothetical protein
MLINDLAETISLAGEWQFQPGFDSPWSVIQVPGCWEAQGYSKYYDGPVTYSRAIFIPAGWAGKVIQLEFEAVSYACTVSINGLNVGEHQGLWTPFSVEVTQAVRPGQENTIEIQVYKPGQAADSGSRYPMRSCLAGFIPDVSTTFGGLWQPVCIRAFDAALEELLLDADIESSSLRVRSRTRIAEPGFATHWQVDVYQDRQLLISQRYPLPHDYVLDTRLVIPILILWSPEEPVIYAVEVSLLNNQVPIARVKGKTGFRRMTANGSQLLLNGRPYMIRGILSWGWEPDRIAPYYSPEQVRAEIQRVRAHGFNLIKLCLFVPNQDYFDIADEEGMLLWQEWPMWLPQVTPELRLRAPQEYQELMHLTRQHPSVVLYSLGCELNRTVDGKLLHKLDQVVRNSVSDVLICDNSGSGESYGGLEFDFADFSDYHPYFDIHFFEPLLDNWRRDWQIPRPWIFGEFCDSDTFRDITQIIHANHGRRPWWLTRDNPITTWRPESQAMLEAQDRLAQTNLPFNPEEITRASLAQTEVIRKYTLESLRKRSGMGGYIVTGLRDTPISTSGIWDDFSAPKWQAENFRVINGDTVLMLDIGRRRQWRFGGDRPDKLDVHNFWSGDQATWHVILHTTGKELPARSRMDWRLADGTGQLIAEGYDSTRTAILPGVPGEAGVISCPLPVVNQAVQLSLQVVIDHPLEMIWNQWPVWVYPPLLPPSTGLGILDPSYLLEDSGAWLEEVPRIDRLAKASGFSILLATSWEPELRDFLLAGGKVIFLQHAVQPLPARRCPFWREAINLFYLHPLWDVFPHQGYTNMQFFGLASDVVLQTQRFQDFLPEITQVRPILRRMDAREFWVGDYLVEVALGQGVLLACSLRLQGGMGAQPFGWKHNVAGGFLLQAMMDRLVDPNNNAGSVTNN